MNNLVKDIITVDQRSKKAFYSSCDEKSTCISAAVGSIWSLTAGYTEQRSRSMFNYTAKLYSTTYIDLSCLLKHISLLTSSSHQNKLWDVISQIKRAITFPNHCDDEPKNEARTSEVQQ